MGELLLHLETETDQGQEVLKEFIALSLLNPEEVLWAIRKSAQGSYDVPNALEQEALDSVNNLLDCTDDGFMIDYRSDFFKHIVKDDREYKNRVKQVSATEAHGPQRQRSVRAIALRGLELYVENQGFGMDD
jgi:hypothetical protein